MVVDKRLFLIVLTAVWCFGAVMTQCSAEPQVTLEVRPTRGSMDDTYTLSIITEGGTVNVVPELAPSDDFQVIGQNTSTEMQITTGQVIQRTIYNFQLEPTRLGTLSTPQVTVHVNGRPKVLEPKSVQVEKGIAPSANRSTGQDVLFRQSVDKLTVYEGEQIHHSLELLWSVPLYELELTPQPFDGFWNESLGKEQKSSAVISGKHYEVLRYDSALYPLRSSTIAISERKSTVKVAQQSRSRGSPFDGIFDLDGFGMGGLFERRTLRSLPLKTNPLEIEVKPLPSPPAEFSDMGLAQPIVGPTTLNILSIPKDLSAGESLTLRFELKSEGNISGLNSLPLSVPSSIKVYQEAPEVKKEITGGKLIMRKVFSISLVPTKGGIFTIPALSIGYFNPQLGAYEKTETEPLQLKVKGGTDQHTTDTTAHEKSVEKNEEASPPVPQYRDETTLERLASQVSLSLAMFVCALALILIALTILLFLILRKKAPEKLAQRAISKAQTLDELDRSFRNLLARRLGVSSAESASGAATGLLKRSALSDDLRLKIQFFLDELDRLRFGGESPKPEALSKLREDAEEISRRAW